MRRLRDIERIEIELLLSNPAYGSSSRLRDRARTRLKKLGLIRFDRKAWQWVVLPEARLALREQGDV